MVAMYIIFLGIIPLILLILFLLYYTRRNVLFWWQKPRKSYVHTILCGGRNFFHKPISIPTFTHSTSLRNLLSKNGDTKNTSTDTRNTGDIKKGSVDTKNVCADTKNGSVDTKIVSDDTKNVSSDTKNFSDHTKNKIPQESAPLHTKDMHEIKIKQPVYYKILHLNDKTQNKKTLKKLDRKINKDDIKIASEVDISTVVKPPVKPKPKASSSKPNVTIVKAGLTSTTNEMIANTKNRSRLHSIKNEK